ncbi:MAG: N-acetyl-alpha-D-glucosaminyl L-malate synthase BshA [Vicinamibacterales bacterium]|jgi:N-acetyl-alpha-D-glucosaminyl L-malate synthase BshA|nr:N-acetyl-alpha-D-glucosaminyl L-malate synthase BshA [Vicinamibacterales bacterium]
MRIGIVCYASLGGSGIVATELARQLVRRSHEVHLLSSEIPFRLRADSGGIVFHPVGTPDYPLFREPQYVISLATRIVQVARERQLDIVHAHYAVPHATAAYLAREILRTECGGRVPAVITTLHGTDITLVGTDPSYAETVRFSIDRSDAVTAVSESLRLDTIERLQAVSPIRVIPNFLDCDRFKRVFDAGLRERLCPAGQYDALVVHLSNFRPVKRVNAVVGVFRRIRERVRARLVLAGEGPDSLKVQNEVEAYGLGRDVEILPPQEDVVPLLSVADLFLLPSLQESFGLAALEAMACEVPVVASRVGGIPEVIDDGITGVLHAPDDLDAMADSAVHLLTDRADHQSMAREGRWAANYRFCVSEVVPLYEALYRELVT